jgi:hypothetical protein
MKKKNLLVLLLLFAMSFNTLHAYVIDVLDTHACGVNEYAHDFSVADEKIDGDICHLHAAFHVNVILSESSITLESFYLSFTPSYIGKIYNYSAQKNFFRPPLKLS